MHRFAAAMRYVKSTCLASRTAVAFGQLAHKQSIRWLLPLACIALMEQAFGDQWIINSDGSYGGRVYEDGRVIDASGNYSGSINGEWIINKDGSYGGRVYEDGRIIRNGKRRDDSRHGSDGQDAWSTDQPASPDSYPELEPRRPPLPRSEVDEALLGGQHYRAVLLAKNSVNFDTKEIRRLVSMPKGLLINEIVTERLLASYDGDFTGYKWRSEEIDPQTYLVFCEMILDGREHDFKFKVNTEVGTCRYEGGTALGKLAPPKAKRTITFLDEE